jgi:crotonobetainyl-CoA:carnitine CoA-transferase CaiB-like acyl-CoA transferase
VVDLSALWAGPLCGQLLAAAGARVVKVESSGRPDGARAGSAEFFSLLNADKQSVALDFDDPGDREILRWLISSADVVIESSRPRALEQLEVRALEVLAHGRPRVWVSITGYGRQGTAGNRIAYGDVAAVAGGLVVEDDEGLCFCADAIADPMTGLVSAVATLEALTTTDRWLLDVAMVDVAARWAGPQLPVPVGRGPQIAPPRARVPSGQAPPLGCDTERVLAALTR